MGMLKNDKNRREKLKGGLLSIINNLDILESIDAECFIKWMIKKSRLYAQAIVGSECLYVPNNMQRGDIVLCTFGENIFPEFSDKAKPFHYVMIWLSNGYNVVVIPLTTKISDNNARYVLDLGFIQGMSAERNYAKLDSIRSISIWRLSKINGVSMGRIRDESAIKKVSSAMHKIFC